MLPRHNCRIDGAAGAPHELDAAASLAGLHESSPFKTALDFAEGCGLSPNLYLNRPDLWGPTRVRFLKVKFEGFIEIR